VICRQCDCRQLRLASRISAPAAAPRTGWQAIAAFKKTSPLWSQSLNTLAPATPIEVWFQMRCALTEERSGLPVAKRLATAPAKGSAYEMLIFRPVCPAAILELQSSCRMPTQAMQTCRRDQSGCCTRRARADILDKRMAHHPQAQAPTTSPWFRCARLPELNARKTSGNTSPDLSLQSRVQTTRNPRAARSMAQPSQRARRRSPIAATYKVNHRSLVLLFTNSSVQPTRDSICQITVNLQRLMRPRAITLHCSSHQRRGISNRCLSVGGTYGAYQSEALVAISVEALRLARSSAA